MTRTGVGSPPGRPPAPLPQGREIPASASARLTVVLRGAPAERLLPFAVALPGSRVDTTAAGPDRRGAIVVVAAVAT